MNQSKPSCLRSSMSTNLKLRCTMCTTLYNVTPMSLSHRIYPSLSSIWHAIYGMLYSRTYHRESAKCILLCVDILANQVCDVIPNRWDFKQVLKYSACQGLSFEENKSLLNSSPYIHYKRVTCSSPQKFALSSFKW